MTTHSCKTEAPEADAVVPYIRRRVGYIIDGGMKQATYRDLQMIARKFGIPRNLKKSALQMLIKANIDGRHQEANAMLKRIQDARLKRKLSRTGKKLGRSSVKTQVEINNNEPNTTMVQAKESRKSEVSELLCSLLKMRPTSKVTIQNTSLYARYRAFSHGNFNLKNSLGCTSSISNVTSVQQTSATMSVAPHTSQVVAVSNSYPLPAALPLADNHPRRHISQVMAVSNTNPLPAALPLADNQPRRHISQVMAVSNTNPLPAALPLADNQPHRHISQVMAVSNTNPLPAALPLADKRPRATSTVVSGEHNDTLFHHCSTSRQISATLNQVKPYVHNNQLYSNGETNEIFGRMYSFQDQHDYRPFERYQLESQTAMTSFPNANNFMGVQNNCQVSETFFGSQQAYIAYDRSSTHNALHQDKLPSFATFVGQENLPIQGEFAVDMDLGLLANSAMRCQKEEETNETIHQETNNNIVMNDFNVLPSCSTTLAENMPAWINSLSKMSTGLTPSVLNNKTSLLCKYGCPVPTSSRSQQVDHEQICQSQPIQCPVVGCNFVTQLSSITPHIFLVHNTEIKYNASESFYLNFKEGRWSFENGRSLLKDGPKNLCFFQVVNGRLFLVNAMGNFEDMQVCVYVQYVNDDLNYKSSVACEVLRPDGVPLQYAGEVYPLTYSPVHIITRRQCLVFNMSHINPKVNHFVLHTNIMNEVV